MSLVDGIWIRKRMAEKDARMGTEARRRAKKARDRTNGYQAVCRLVDARDGCLCRVCALPLREGAHHHHITPRSLGGQGHDGQPLPRVRFLSLTHPRKKGDGERRR